MIIHWLTVLIAFFIVTIHADTIKPKRVSNKKLVGKERGLSNIISNDLFNHSWQSSTPKKILIRVTRSNENAENPLANQRHRREIVEKIQTSDFVMNIVKSMGDADSADEILGMARKVAITVFILLISCIICCGVTTLYVCIKCCCSGKNNRKRNQGYANQQQPIIIHTSPSNYQPPYYHPQQASPPVWNPENHPMLPQPSAPPPPMDDFPSERPPPYEKICNGR